MGTGLRRSIALGMTLVLLGHTLTGCGKVEEEETLGLTEITMALDGTPTTFHSGLYAALDQGYFQEAGLDVTFVEPSEDGATQMVSDGDTEFGIACQDALAENFASDNQLPVTAVMALLQHNPDGILSLTVNDIDTPVNLVEHSYAASDSIVEYAMMKEVVEEAGGDFSQVTKVETYVENVSDTLAEGVSAVIGNYGWDGIQCEWQNQKIQFWLLREQNSVFDYYKPLIIANNTFLTENPDMARAFLAAVQKGYTYTMTHQSEVARLLAKELPKMDSDVIYSSQRYMSGLYLDDADTFGYIDEERWNSFYQWVNEKKLFENEIPENTGFTNEFLE